MIMTIVGLRRKSGEFQNKPYDNFYVNVLITDSGDSTVIAGVEIAEFKIKADEFTSALTRCIGALNSPDVKEAKDIIGLWFYPAYSKFRGVTNDFTLAIPDSKKK